MLKNLLNIPGWGFVPKEAIEDGLNRDVIRLHKIGDTIYMNAVVKCHSNVITKGRQVINQEEIDTLEFQIWHNRWFSSRKITLAEEEKFRNYEKEELGDLKTQLIKNYTI